MAKRDDAPEQQAPPLLEHGDLFSGSEIGTRARALAWEQTPFGPPDSWPQSLRAAAGICLNSRFPIAIYWGPQLALLYNDAWSPILGRKHPWALGRPGREVWPEIWDAIGPLFEAVQSTGEGVWQQDQLLAMDRHGYTEECYFNFTFSPIRGEDGGVAGIFNAVIETTYRVIEERRAGILRDLAARTAGATAGPDVYARAAALLDNHAADVPFCLCYVRDHDGAPLQLAAAAGSPLPVALCPPVIDPDDPHAPWPAARALETPRGVLVEGIAVRGRHWPEPVTRAVAIPVAALQGAGAVGLLVIGVSPRLALDDTYRTFLERVAMQLAAAVGSATSYEAERRRAEALAAIDQAKTLFFSNVSHEFRTPLTLLLGPLEDALAEGDALPPSAREHVEIAHRNGLRLLKLVNTLLDFARIEAGRLQATFRPTDLAELTADVASAFRSAIERAGLRFTVSSPPLDEPVYVDAELWEQIVLNLLSNAFKFTLSGAIEVALRQRDGAAELTVRDTGAGIPADELPHLFERFHRVQGASGRSFEGSGIGLAMVQELVRLHGGSVEATSQLGRGSTFTVRIPTGTGHLPPEQLAAAIRLDAPRMRRVAFVEEALRWTPEARDADAGTSAEAVAAPADPASLPRILLADDNADMRDYVERLLSREYAVVAVADGAQALELARAEPFDLVLSDVMMPRLDGFGLLAALRAAEATSTLPVILLSARAGEEARVEGLDAGADDYLIKPFSANELRARVRTALALAAQRRETEARLRSSEARIRLALRAHRMVTWEWLPHEDLITTSDNFAEIYGLPALSGAAEGFALVWAQDKPAHLRNVQQIALGGGEYRSEFRITRPDTGELVWLEERAAAFLDDNGQVVRVVGVTIDVTERKRAEEALRESEEKYRALTELSSHMVWMLSPEGEIGYLSPKWFDYTGVDLALLRERGWLDLLHPDDRARISAEFATALAGGDEYSMELRLLGQDGHYRWHLTRARPIRDQDAAIVRWLGVTFDIHERKLAEDELRVAQELRLADEQRYAAQLQRLYVEEQKLRAAAEEANRLKDEFLATVSHELRTPLTALFGYAQLLQSRKRDEEYVARTVEKILRSARDQALIIDDLLDVSRIVSGKLRIEPRPIELIPVVHAAIDTVRPAVEAKSLRLEVELHADASHVVVDANRMQQVIWNLLANAAKFTPPGGTIWVGLARDGGEAVLTVRDSGVGISPAFLPFVFDRFRQADSASNRVHGGLGLGLAIVRHLVELHGGTVQAASAGEYQGASFTVRLPLGDDAGAADTAPQRCPPELQGLRVLLVDDQPAILELLQEVLAPCGSLVQTAATARAGLATLRGWRPDVLISDIAMPGEDGYWLIEQLRALPPAEGGATPAIALTAYVRAEERARVLAAGYQLYVPKPVEPGELRDVLAHLVRERAARDE